jgi:hypothetical protein
MTANQVIELFSQHNDKEFLNDDHRNPQYNDLRAFTLLKKLVPSQRDVITAAEHDEIWLDMELEELAPKITEDQIVELLRCGVGLDTDSESLHMFV